MAPAARRMGRRQWLAQAAIVLVVLAAHALTASARAINQIDYREMTFNVTNMARSQFFGSPDLMYGGAGAIVVDTAGKPIVTAGTQFLGRVVHYGSDGFSDAGWAFPCCSGNGLGKLFMNTVRWAGMARGLRPKGQPIRVAGSTDYVTATVVEKMVLEAPLQFISVGTWAPEKVWRNKVDVYVINGEDSRIGNAADKLFAYVAGGGGIVVSAHAFNWGRDQPLVDHPANKLLIQFGIIMTGEPTQANAPVDPKVMPFNPYNADVSLACLTASCIGNVKNPCYTDSNPGIWGFRDLCARVDEYMPAGAGYRISLPSTARRVKIAQLEGVACDAIEYLYDNLAPPRRPPPPPPPADPIPTVTKGMFYKLWVGSKPFLSYPTNAAAREWGTASSINYYCGRTCISQRYRENFAVRMRGFIKVSAGVASNPVRISVTCSGQARVTIGSRQVPELSIYDGSSTSLVTKTVSTTLVSGEIPITLEFLHANGPSTLQLVWQPAGQPNFSEMPLYHRKTY